MNTKDKKTLQDHGKTKYNAPQIINLDEQQIGSGDCIPGSGDGIVCDTGNAASGLSGCRTGNSANGVCLGTGSSATGNCVSLGSGF